MVIGEAPGADEDRQGEPFVGRAGQLLNSMLKAIGLQREQVFIANILKSRPPNNRDPRPEEVQACIPYLFRQIELVNPKLILCVGRIAAQTLLETDTPIGKLRGQLHRIAGNRPMIVTYHPAYLLRSPGEKRKSWADLLLALRTFERSRRSADMSAEIDRAKLFDSVRFRPMALSDVPTWSPWSAPPMCSRGARAFSAIASASAICAGSSNSRARSRATASCRTAPAKRTSSISASAATCAAPVSAAV